jgi:exodeoxyribonuclease VII small subunit
MTKQAVDYQKLNQELETLLMELDSEQGDIDESIKKYQRGMEIVKLLEDYLKTAENKVKKVKAEL